MRTAVGSSAGLWATTLATRLVLGALNMALVEAALAAARREAESRLASAADRPAQIDISDSLKRNIAERTGPARGAEPATPDTSAEIPF
jgi:hypothetical protein